MFNILVTISVSLNVYYDILLLRKRIGKDKLVRHVELFQRLTGKDVRKME